MFNGKINYKWAIFNSYVKLPEDTRGYYGCFSHIWVLLSLEMRSNPSILGGGVADDADMSRVINQAQGNLKQIQRLPVSHHGEVWLKIGYPMGQKTHKFHQGQRILIDSEQAPGIAQGWDGWDLSQNIPEWQLKIGQLPSKLWDSCVGNFWPLRCHVWQSIPESWFCINQIFLRVTKYQASLDYLYTDLTYCTSKKGWITWISH